MALPTIRGVIARRILVNYRVDPVVLARQLPAPFRPKIVDGHGLAGICLIRLKQIRPAGLPSWFGIASENAAHRVAVEWDDVDGVRSGVYVGRRDTGCWANTLAGGRIFPGVHHRGKFTVRESSSRIEVALQSDDRQVQLAVCGRPATQMPRGSVFGSLAEASEFFRAGSLGYSPARQIGCFQGLELRCERWLVEPLAIETICSSYFDDASRFPPGSVEFDCALLMRDIPHQWHAIKTLTGSARQQGSSQTQEPSDETAKVAATA